VASKENGSVEVTLSPDRVTKNTVRFEEVTEGEFDVQKLGQLYVPKSTLGAIGFAEGNSIKVTITLV